MPVAAYSPELIALFEAAATEEKILGPFTSDNADRFRSRMNKLRVAMRVEKHPALPLAERVTIKKKQGLSSGEFMIVCTPDPDRDFVQAIKDAGIQLPEYREEEFADEAEAQESSSDVLRDFVSGDKS